MDLWKKTLDALQSRVKPYDFQHWILPIECDHIDDQNNEIVLKVPDDTHGRWVEENFVRDIRQTLRSFTESDYRVRFTYYGGYDDDRAATADKPARPKPEPAGAPPELIGRYRFEAFVDGPTNQFAMTAARAVAEYPGTRYNPLFIFGGVGLGKTHLLHAIGHAVVERYPEKRVFYVTSETYVNDLISAIRNDKMSAFRKRYRDDCDVLLIDDIQFIAGKDRSQEEFFHIFNTLHSSHKQIVMTSDQLPASIPDLEDRVKSRLQWGLIADVKPPGFETRVAILKRKAEADGIDLPDDVAMLIARHVTQNVRELEGALMRLDASARLMGRPMDIDLVSQALGDLIGTSLRRVQPEAVVKAICAEFKVSATDLKGPRRHRNITVPRQIAMYLVRELCDESLPQIGALFGGRDHSTVINALKRVEAMRDADPSMRTRIEGVRRQLRAT
ncbi:MAG: chromosomal replication initiator protein DnaA [Deltaproteobacteria bacterium]|nr:chromosomal replication initiator protein DnaA [Deltaproteobacteria bacterium]